MKNLLLIIALFTSFTINAATYSYPIRIEFSNDIIVEFGVATYSSHSPHGGGGTLYYHDVQVTYNDELYISQFADDNFGGDGSSYPFGELGWYLNGFNYPETTNPPVPDDIKYGSYLCLVSQIKMAQRGVWVQKYWGRVNSLRM